MPSQKFVNTVLDLLDEKRVPRTGMQPSPTGIPPLWILRALAKDSPRTADNESIQSGSGEHKGKEILFPTIRFKKGKLKRFDNKTRREHGFTDAMMEALRQGDFLTFNTPTEATAFSTALSNELGRSDRKFSVFLGQKSE